MNGRSSSATAISKPRTGVRAATAAAILRAAEEAFAESGIRDTHVSAIAARAGMAVGTLYNHFRDRDALLTALLDERRRELLDRMDRALADGGGTFVERLTRVVQDYFDYFVEHRPFFQILLEGELGRCLTVREEIYERLKRLMRRGAREGQIGDPEFATAMLMGMMRALKMRDRYLRGSGAISVGDMIHFFLHGANAR